MVRLKAESKNGQRIWNCSLRLWWVIVFLNNVIDIVLRCCYLFSFKFRKNGMHVSRLGCTWRLYSRRLTFKDSCQMRRGSFRSLINPGRILCVNLLRYKNFCIVQLWDLKVNISNITISCLLHCIKFVISQVLNILRT